MTLKDDCVSTAKANIPLSLTDQFIHAQSQTVLKASSRVYIFTLFLLINVLAVGFLVFVWSEQCLSG